jgi:hypothetical protein
VSQILATLDSGRNVPGVGRCFRHHFRCDNSIGWSWGCASAVDSNGRTIWIAHAHRDANRYIVRADEKLTAFPELESVIRSCGELA